MQYLYSLCWETVSLWFPGWENNGSWDNLDGWLNGGASLKNFLADLGGNTLPDFIYLVMCILVTIAFFAGLCLLFKWMFTLVWRLFKID